MAYRERSIDCLVRVKWLRLGILQKRLKRAWYQEPGGEEAKAAKIEWFAMWEEWREVAEMQRLLRVFDE